MILIFKVEFMYVIGKNSFYCFLSLLIAILVSTSCEKRDFETKTRIIIEKIEKVSNSEAKVYCRIAEMEEGLLQYGISWSLVNEPNVDNEKTVEMNPSMGKVFVSTIDIRYGDKTLYVWTYYNNGKEIVFDDSLSFEPTMYKVLWTKTLDRDYIGTYMKRTRDKGIITTGHSSKWDASANSWVHHMKMAKINADFEKEWHNLYFNNNRYFGTDVVEDDNGNFYFLGTISCDDENSCTDNNFVIKTNSQGTILWNKPVGGDNYVSAIDVMPNGDVLIAGTSFSEETKYDWWLYKINADGDLLDEIVFDYVANLNYVHSMRITPDDGILITGTISLLEDSYWKSKFHIVKANFNGEKLWEKTYDKDNDIISFDKIVFLEDNSYLVNGYTYYSNSEDKTGYIFRFDKEGNEIWNKQYQGYSSFNFISESVEMGYIFSTPGKLGKMDSNGNILWDIEISDVRFIEETDNSTYIVTKNVERSEIIPDTVVSR